MELIQNKKGNIQKVKNLSLKRKGKTLGEEVGLTSKSVEKQKNGKEIVEKRETDQRHGGAPVPLDDEAHRNISLNGSSDRDRNEKIKTGRNE